MKMYTLVIVALVVFGSCQSGKTTNKSGAEDSAKQNRLPADEIWHLVNAKEQWVNASFIEDVRKTNSPAASMKKIPGILQFYTSGGDASKDSLKVTCRHIFDETGVGFTVYAQRGTTDNSLLMKVDSDKTNMAGYYDMAYAADGKDTFIVISHYGKDKKLLTKDRYSSGWSEQEIPLRGTYKSLVPGGTAPVVFDAGGVLSGIKGVDGYSVELTSGIDIVHFHLLNTSTMGEGNVYAYRINGDSLLLYSTKEILPAKRKDGQVWESGKPAYMLVRQR